MPSDLRTKWFFTDARSHERDVQEELRIQVRAVSGQPVPTNGLPVVSLPDDNGHQLLSLTGLNELMRCVREWACPVTISPAEGDLPWILELEDGIRPDSPLLAGLERDPAK